MLTLLLLALQAVPATVPPAPWQLHQGTDAAANTSWASAAAMSADRNYRLTVRCDRTGEPTVSIQFAARQPLTAGAAHTVTIAVDGAAPIPADWQFPGRAAVISDPAMVTALTVAMANAQQITVSTTDSAGAVSASVPGPAGNPSLAAVLTACGYTLGQVPAPTASPTPGASPTTGAMEPGQ